MFRLFVSGPGMDPWRLGWKKISMADSTVHSKQPLAFEYGWPCYSVLFLWVLSGKWLSPSCKAASVPKTSTEMSQSAGAPHSLTEVSYPPVTLPQKARAILQARYWLNITKLLCDKIPKKQARYLRGALDRRTNPPTLLCLLQEPWASGSLSYGSILTLLQPFPSCCSLSYRLFKSLQSVHPKTKRTHYRAGKDILWKLQIMPRSCEPWSLVPIWEPLNSLGIIYLCIRHKICD